MHAAEKGQDGINAPVSGGVGEEAKAPQAVSCANCRFYKMDAPGIGGSCVRYPPQIVSESIENIPAAYFPYVEGSDWCGEFSQKPAILFPIRGLVPDPSYRNQFDENLNKACDAMSALGLTEYQNIEATILSGQMPQERVPGYMAEHPEFAAWYRKRQFLRKIEEAIGDDER